MISSTKAPRSRGASRPGPVAAADGESARAQHEAACGGTYVARWPQTDTRWVIASSGPPRQRLAASAEVERLDRAHRPAARAGTCARRLRSRRASPPAATSRNGQSRGADGTALSRDRIRAMAITPPPGVGTARISACDRREEARGLGLRRPVAAVLEPCAASSRSPCKRDGAGAASTVGHPKPAERRSRSRPRPSQRPRRRSVTAPESEQPSKSRQSGFAKVVDALRRRKAAHSSETAKDPRVSAGAQTPSVGTRSSRCARTSSRITSRVVGLDHGAARTRAASAADTDASSPACLEPQEGRKSRARRRARTAGDTAR